MCKALKTLVRTSFFALHVFVICLLVLPVFYLFWSSGAVYSFRAPSSGKMLSTASEKNTCGNFFFFPLKGISQMSLIIRKISKDDSGKALKASMWNNVSNVINFPWL